LTPNREGIGDALAGFFNASRFAWCFEVFVIETSPDLVVNLGTCGGVGPEVSVGICIERSLDMAVGLLAILKAGGAYVPLDSASPQPRLTFMLEDTRAQILLTQSRFQKLFASFAGTRVCIDNDWADIARESPENPTNAAAPENLAYVIYTSGSTGQPKGVMIEHRQLMNYLAGVTERLDLTSQKSFATVSTLAADLGHTVIFPALLTGAVLHIISQDRITDAEALADYFGRHAIDCLKIWECIICTKGLQRIHSVRQDC